MTRLEYWLTHLVLASAAQAWTRLDVEAFVDADHAVQQRATYIARLYGQATRDMRTLGLW